MNQSILTIIFALLLLGGTSSCKKEKVTLSWTQINTTVSSDLTALHFLDGQHGFAVGGETWSEALALETQDGGQTWQEETIGPKQIYALTFDPQGVGYAVGNDGLLYVKDANERNWEIQRLARWDSHQGVAVSGQEAIVVSGIAYAGGVIQRIFADYSSVVLDTFENELSAVYYSDSQTVHVVGYGLILRSTNGGDDWEVSPEQGDFFRDVYFPTPQVGYIVGYAGSILKTTDAGENWEWLRRGDALLVNNKFFRAVHFADTERGYVVGDKGLFWRTLDGGETWQVDDGFPEVDFFDVNALANGGCIVGEEGTIIVFED